LRGRIYGVIAEVAEKRMRETSGQFESAISGFVTQLLKNINIELGEDARISMPRDLSNVFENLDFQYTDQDISLDNRGDGIKGRYIPLILKFISDQKRQLATRGSPPHTFIWAYEEPENNLEFRRAQELADTFCELADGEQTQILMTTHSPIFYNLVREKGDDRSAIHVSAPSTDIGTLIVDASDEELELDERMGVMPITAPYIEEAENELQRLRASEAIIRKQLDSQSRPSLFVEGKSDFLVFAALLEKVRPAVSDQVAIAEPPSSGAGAEYVADSLVAWHLVQKNQPTECRLSAYGIFDRDGAGKDAAKRVTQLTNGSYSAKSFLPLPERFKNAYKVGLKLPITLEEIYPEDYWEHAQSQGWLESREKKSVLSRNVVDKVLNGEATFDDLAVEAGGALALRYKPKGKKKVAWARWVANKNASQLEIDLPDLLRCLDNALDSIIE
jgi:hypothetical protein